MLAAPGNDSDKAHSLQDRYYAPVPGAWRTKGSCGLPQVLARMGQEMLNQLAGGHGVHDANRLRQGFDDLGGVIEWSALRAVHEHQTGWDELAQVP